MSERPRKFGGDPPPQEDRRVFLRGKVPDHFLYQMRPSGMQVDYANTYHGALFFMGRSIPEDSSRLTLLPDREAEIRDHTKVTPTYTDYWKNRIKEHNPQTGESLVREEDVLPLLVTEQPGAQELDAIATEVQQIAASDVSTEVFVESYIRCAARAFGIIWGNPEKERETLARFGLQPEEPSD